jgi:hypothetical protein
MDLNQFVPLQAQVLFYSLEVPGLYDYAKYRNDPAKMEKRHTEIEPHILGFIADVFDIEEGMIDSLDSHWLDFVYEPGARSPSPHEA